MTRETKVGLVVGTGIILLIGIIVSDHLSTQNREQPRTVAPPGYVDAAPAKPRAVESGKAVTDRAVDSGTLPRDNRTDGGNSFGARLDKGASLQQIDGVRRADGGAATSDNHGAIDRNLVDGLAGQDKGRVEIRGFPPGDGGAGLRTDGSLPGGSDARGATVPPTFVDGGRGSTDPIPPVPPTPPGTRPDANLPQPSIHYTQPRDTLWSLSKRYYGDGKYFGVIAKANPDKLLANGNVRDGVRLEIPNKSLVVPGVAAPGGTGTVPGNGERGAVNGTADGATAGRTIKVEAGDTLGTLALKHLGSSRLVNQIIDANKDQIRDANDIKVGMVLKLPAAPSAPPTGSLGPALRTEGERRPDGAAPPAPAPGVPATARAYKVQPGDTFTSIARSRLGSDRRWKELFELNKVKVGDPENLRDGMVIVLPADAR